MNGILHVAIKQALSAQKPRGHVDIDYRWSVIKAALRSNPVAQAVSDSIDLKTIEKMLPVLFEFTPHIKTVGVCTVEFESQTIRSSVNEAWLLDLDPSTDRLTLRVCLHPNVIAVVRLQLGPRNSLARSSQELCSAMATIRGAFPPTAVADSHTEVQKTRLEEKVRLVEGLFERCPKATLEEKMLMVTYVMRKTALRKKTKFMVPMSSYVDVFRLICVKDRPSLKDLDKTLEILERNQEAEPRHQFGGRENNISVHVLEKGWRRLGKLLSENIKYE